MSRRLPAVVIILGGLVSLVVVDLEAPAPEVPVFGFEAGTDMPTADLAGALSSTWFCAAGGASEAEGTATAVVVANAGDDDRSGTVTWYTGETEPTVVPLEVPALGAVEVEAADSVSAGVVSATVEVDGGEVGVEHRVSTDRGVDTAPCASSASPTWHFANGTTDRDASQRLVLFNPLPDDAVVDVSFSTSEGRDEPASLQGLPVAAGTTSVIELTEVVRRREVTATSVVARRGRLVVDRVQSFDGSDGRTGLALALGAPAPAELWTFPEGYYTDGITVRWHLYNPSDREALASLEIVPGDGEVPEPVDLTIPPFGQVTVEAAELGRVGPDVGHHSVVRSLDGVPVVAERSITARAPARRVGWTSALGATSASPRWLLPAGGTSDDLDQWLVVVNPGPGDVTVDVAALVGGRLLAIEGLQGITLGPADREVVRLGTLIERDPLPLVVAATGDVVVERNVYQVSPDVDGVSSSFGIPLG